MFGLGRERDLASHEHTRNEYAGVQVEVGPTHTKAGHAQHKKAVRQSRFVEMPLAIVHQHTRTQVESHAHL